MTGRKEFCATLNGQHADHLPCMPITMMFAADILGVKYGQYARGRKTMADAQLKTAEIFGLDHVSTISNHARDHMGGKVQWYQDQPPAVIEEESLFADKLALARVRAPDPFSGGRMEDRIRGVELLRRQIGQELLVEAGSRAPAPSLPIYAGSIA